MKTHTKIFAAGLLATGIALPLAYSYAGHSGFQTAHAGHGQRGGPDNFCRHNPADKAEEVIEYVDGFMVFNEAQTPAWENLKAAVRSGGDRIEDTCADLKAEGRPTTAPEKLARMETMISSGAAALQEIRPAFDAFYQTLSEKQQDALDKLSRHGKRRHGHDQED